MSDLRLIEAVKSDDQKAAAELIESGADVNQQDEQGWTPLCWAAGKGSTAMAQLLIEAGGDMFKAGDDQRTPYDIALAAGHAGLAELLIMAAEKTGRPLDGEPRRYCRAYSLGELRRFSGWREDEINRAKPESPASISDNGAGGLPDEIAFLHQDFTVTLSMWQDEEVIFNDVTNDWREFCIKELGFKTPTDLDLISGVKA